MDKDENEKEIERLNNSLDDVRIDSLSPGERTRRLLKRKGIKSPECKNMVLVSTNPMTWKEKK